MNITPDLIHRTKRHWDVEDLALEFMETEVGRFDWIHNWPKVKATGTAPQRIKQWLEAMNVEASPDEIIEYLDNLVTKRAGRWL